MAKEDVERINVRLPPDLTKLLRTYCLARANKQGRVTHDIKAKIGRAALKEWLEKHGKDYDIKL